MNSRVLQFLALAAMLIGAAAYVYMDKKKSSLAPDPNLLLATLPAAISTDTRTPAKEWTQSLAIGRYDTMQRSGTRMFGSWAAGIREACMASAPISSIPDEGSWKRPIVVHKCFDGVPVFRIELKE